MYSATGILSEFHYNHEPSNEKINTLLKAMLHGAIFLATCNAILLLNKIAKYESSLHSADVF